MERYETTKLQEGIRIEGFPDAAKLVKIDGPKAQRLAGLVLHCVDLTFAADCLTAIGDVNERPSVVQLALWRSSIIHFMKCFGGAESRFQLNSNKVFAGQPPEAIDNFSYFANFRNKHLIHDENAYAQCLPGAVINRPDKSYKVEKIISFCAIADVLDEGSLNNLRLLIITARKWVEEQHDSLCDLLTKELEVEPYAKLVAREEVKYSKPTFDDMGKTRRPV